MARSKLLIIAAAVLLTACETATVAPAPAVVAPRPVEYTCEQYAQAAAEFRSTKPGGMLRRIFDDYRMERKQLRAIHKIPEPPPCPASGPTS